MRIGIAKMKRNRMILALLLVCCICLQMTCFALNPDYTFSQEQE